MVRGRGQRLGLQRRTHLWRRSITILCHRYIVPVVGIEKHDKRARLVTVVAVVGGGGNWWPGPVVLTVEAWAIFFAQVDSNAKSKSITAWTDAWQVCEDVFIICAGLWMGSWRGNSHSTSFSTPNWPENWSSVRLDGDDDLTCTYFVSGILTGKHACSTRLECWIWRDSGLSDAEGYPSV